MPQQLLSAIESERNEGRVPRHPAKVSLPLGFFTNLFSSNRQAKAAKQAELRGDLPRAVELFVAAGLPNEAARVMLLRGDSDPDAKARLQHFTQAASLATDEEMKVAARKKRANLVIALATDFAHSAVGRRDMAEAADELMELGEGRAAAAAYRLLGDKSNEARALELAGDVEELEFILSEQAMVERSAARKQEDAQRVSDLIAQGNRREAMALAEALQKAGPSSTRPGDIALLDAAREAAGRRCRGPIVRVALGNERVTFIVGAKSVVIGRADALLTVASPSLSRQHLSITKSGSEFLVEDLKSRNGTFLRGMKMTGHVPVGERLELKLGGEVPLVLAPSRRSPGSLELDLGGEHYIVPFGPAQLGILDWTLDWELEDWVVLRTSAETPPLAGELALTTTCHLLVGDALSKARGEAPIFRVIG